MNTIKFIRRKIFDQSQTEFAEMIGARQSTVSKWEKGALYPKLDDLSRIRLAAQVRGIPWSDSFFFEIPEVKYVPSRAEPDEQEDSKQSEAGVVVADRGRDDSPPK